MLSISEVKNINFENFFNYARNIGVYINKELYVKQIHNNNNGIFIKNSINPNQLLISLPQKLAISKNTFKNFILGWTQNLSIFRNKNIKSLLLFTALIIESFTNFKSKLPLPPWQPKTKLFLFIFNFYTLKCKWEI